MNDLLRKRSFGQLLRSISLNMNDYSPQSIEISDSKSHFLATTLILGQTPSGVFLSQMSNPDISCPEHCGWSGCRKGWLEYEACCFSDWLGRHQCRNVGIQNALFQPVCISDTSYHEGFHGRLAFVANGNDQPAV